MLVRLIECDCGNWEEMDGNTPLSSHENFEFTEVLDCGDGAFQCECGDSVESVTRDVEPVIKIRKEPPMNLHRKKHLASQAVKPMNLTQAIDYFTANLPHDPTDEDEILNKCVKGIQDALGQPHGDAAGEFFSGTEWISDWRESKTNLVLDYVKYELNHLPVNVDDSVWVVTVHGYIFKVECSIDETLVGGGVFTDEKEAVEQVNALTGNDDEYATCAWTITADKVVLDDRSCSDGKVLKCVESFLNDFEM